MRPIIFLLAFNFAACQTPSDPPLEGGGSDAGTNTTEPDPALSFYRDIKPILDSQCTQCHAPGAIGPVDLTNPQTVQSWATVIERQVMTGQMPPWHPDEACNTYVDERRLSEADQIKIQDWTQLGAPIGEIKDKTTDPRVPQGLSRVDRELRIEGPHTPDSLDDYRCFAMQWPETSQKYITGYEVRPTNPAIVHHVNVFIIDAAHAAAQLIRQENASKPGFECFGGQFDPGTALLGSWVPGITQRDFPANSGILIEPGSVIMMEMHFNTAGGNASPDESSLALKLEDTVDKRAMVAAFWDFSNWNGSGGMLIPANAPSTTHSFEFDPKNILPQFAPWIQSNTLQIHAVGLHMHYLGQRARLEVQKYSGENQCLLQIKNWDFNWQSGYFLKEPVTFEIGKDKMYLECEWDNTADHQPVINGVPRTPSDVTWGSDSDDEMCIGLFYVTE